MLSVKGYDWNLSTLLHLIVMDIISGNSVFGLNEKLPAVAWIYCLTCIKDTSKGLLSIFTSKCLAKLESLWIKKSICETNGSRRRSWKTFQLIRSFHGKRQKVDICKYNQLRPCHTWSSSEQSKVLPWFPFHWAWRKTKDKNRYAINLLVAKSSSVPYILVEVINYIFKRSLRQKTKEPKSIAGKNPLNRGNHQHFLNFVFISSLVNAWEGNRKAKI